MIYSPAFDYQEALSLTRLEKKKTPAFRKLTLSQGVCPRFFRKKKHYLHKP